MAIDREKESKQTEDRIVELAAENTDTKTRLSDQCMAYFGTNRTSEIKAKIGAKGRPFWAAFDYELDSF